MKLQYFFTLNVGVEYKSQKYNITIALALTLVNLIGNVWGKNKFKKSGHDKERKLIFLVQNDAIYSYILSFGLKISFFVQKSFYLSDTYYIISSVFVLHGQKDP